VSFPLAFAAGVVSFLSPCVLPVVPSYLAFVSGLTFGEMTERPSAAVRTGAALHSILFVAGFSAVFLTLGLVATAAGPLITRTLPWMSRLGGVLGREARVQLESRPVGAVGSFVVGLAFGAGWTPCIGPILGSILLYASLEATMTHGAALLGTYALGLGIPFVASAVGLTWFIAASDRARRWVVPLQRAAGTVLVLMGLFMVSGHFARVTAALAGGLGSVGLNSPARVNASIAPW